MLLEANKGELQVHPKMQTCPTVIRTEMQVRSCYEELHWPFTATHINGKDASWPSVSKPKWNHIATNRNFKGKEHSHACALKLHKHNAGDSSSAAKGTVTGGWLYALIIPSDRYPRTVSGVSQRIIHRTTLLFFYNQSLCY